MMPAQQALRVHGLRELQRAFSLADKTLATELRTSLRQVAEPVRADAEQLAQSRIRRIGIPWSQMRVGVTQSLVYVAPRQRGRRSTRRRPNLATLLMDRAMSPALDANESRVLSEMESLLGSVGRAWEHV